ncbi:LysR family transcriptional regulator [Teichococcus cervicalis]|uniref:LysR substrate binding domain protein n=1 Tax=Pseudoroseomonas cervicalis ATCC 49957 TaxID=525371 RepID=D5RPY8_9PROT|nr:LysR family transcriptional regulator [Pseudoroseomonas cervicalis]EFH10635.1 LysR substrate binding domain protein [Pseudoroseomonas cervicalis ATCC 49957]
MITLKQIEALHWIAELGSFERAAARLGTTQSTISKRIQQLEAAFGRPLFDRSQRGARLTEWSEQLLALGREMLALQERMVALQQGGPPPARRLRLGVTELCAITWLPQLIAALGEAHAGLTIEPEVDLSRTLHERLAEGSIDLIIVPEGLAEAEMAVLPLARVRNAWMARPGLVTQPGPLAMHELASHPILIQGRGSGSGLFFEKWFRAEGIALRRTLATDSLMAMVGLTVAGLGVSYLPRECFEPLVRAGKLAVIETRPALPDVPYAAIYRRDRPSAFIAAVAGIAREVCDYARPLQG